MNGNDNEVVRRYDAFLSYNRFDKIEVEAIAKWLKDQAKVSVWFDNWTLKGGDPWQEEMETALDKSDCCVVFCGPHGIGNWQNMEWRSALGDYVSDKKIRVIPVLLPGGVRSKDLPKFLKQLTWVKFRKYWNDKNALYRLECSIKNIVPGIAPEENKDVLCPFRGLRVFREQDYGFFFGRETVVDQLLDKINSQRFLAILGHSGCGKSSIVQAGLIPYLREQATVALFTPRERPIEELGIALRKCYSENNIPDVEKIIERLKESKNNLHYIAREIVGDSNKKKLVIVIDQFEEFFRPSSTKNDHDAFIQALLNAIKVKKGPVSVIITMRSDFKVKFAPYPELNKHVRECSFHLGHMKHDELRRAIEEPARLVGLEFEEGLVDRILRELKNSPGELSLLEHVLLELYKGREGKRITFQTYENTGGIEGALVKQAESEFITLSDEKKKIFQKMIVLRLVQPGEGTLDTKRKATKEEILATGGKSRYAKDLLIQWTDARLFTTTEEPTRGQDFVEVAHESLIRRWDRLQEWMVIERDVSQQMGRLRYAAQEWERSGKNPSYLFQGGQQIQMESLLKSLSKDLTKLERQFVDAGSELREKNEKEKQAARLRRSIIKIVSIAFLVAVLVAAFAIFQMRRADSNYLIAVSGRMTLEMSLMLPEDNIKAIRIAEAGYKVRKNEPFPSAQRALGAAAYSAFERPFYKAVIPQDGKATLALFSPAGDKILSVSQDKIARLWDLNGRLLAVMRHNYKVSTAVFSTIGANILTAAGNIAKLWNKEGKHLVDFTQHKDKISSIAFSPDGTKVITTSWDKTAKLYGLNGEVLASLGHADRVDKAIFSPDGNSIATVSWDNTAKLWDLKGNLIDEYKHSNYISSLKFSPDGTKLLTASWDNTAKLWNLRGELLADFNKHTDYVWDAVFSNEGGKIITASSDNRSIVWDLEGNVIHELNHGDRVENVVVSPDDKYILTRSKNTVKLWDITGKLIAALEHGASEVDGVDFSPDGKRILTRSGLTAKIWDLSGNLKIDFDKHSDYVSSAAFSRDGSRVVTASWDNTVLMWDVKDGLLIDVIENLNNVNSSLLSYDGQKILSWLGQKASLWDVAAGTIVKSWELAEPLKNAAISPEGKKILLISHENIVSLWDWDRVLVNNLNLTMATVNGASFFPDGKGLLIWSENMLNIFDFKGKLLSGYQFENNISCAAISADGEKLLTAFNDNMVTLWDRKKNPLAHFNKHTESVLSVSFSPDGTKILTASADDTAKLWELKGNLLADLNKHMNDVLSAVFSSDGTRIITLSRDGTVKKWYTPEAIMEWLKDAPIPKLSKEDKENLGIADLDLD